MSENNAYTATNIKAFIMTTRLILRETTCPAADTPLSVLAALWKLI